MKIIVAGASGAIGRPLLPRLVDAGHQVTALSRSERADAALRRLGADPVRADALDRDGVRRVVEAAGADVIIDELTSLPASPADMASAAGGDRRIRIDGGGNLLMAAQEIGVGRYILQSSGFFLAADHGLADETAPMQADAPGGVGASARTYAELERRLRTAAVDGVLLRYGFFYGPGTWYWPDGAVGEQARGGALPILGAGSATWSFVHVDDAAAATVAALDAPPGTYNIVDDEPRAVADWLPAFARWVGGAEPARVSAAEALAEAGEDTVFYHNGLTGATNAKAKAELGLVPRPQPWFELSA